MCLRFLYFRPNPSPSARPLTTITINRSVDIIAIDFSQTRFRLKQPLIKAAIERGVYFEITYSGLVMDAQLRRQMISNAKLLVDWTRGKSIIFSSAAPSVTELRGPYDVANLACLLGFSLERAKASVSKTCRALLESSLRKKKFIKEAIRIELLSPAEQTDGFDDWLKWDPISSGEGDLQLDDMAKSFAASNKESKMVKAIDFVSIMDELPSHGLQFKDMVYESNLVQGEFTYLLNIEVLERENIRATGDDIAVTPESSSFPLSGASLNEPVPKEHSSLMGECVSIVPSCTMATLGSDDELQNNGANSAVHQPLEDVSMEVQVELKDDGQMNHLYTESSSSERVGRKQGSSRGTVSFPFKRLLRPSHFKKVSKYKTKGTILSLSDLTG